MVLDMVVHNPNFFAAAVATCPAIDQQNINTYGQGREITDDELKAIDTPIWVVQAKDDTTVKYEESALRVYNLLKDKGAILTTYETGGHASWTHTAKNEPDNNGEHVWQWTAKQILPASQPSETTNSSQENTSNVGYYAIIGIAGASLLEYYVFKKKKGERQK